MKADLRAHTPPPDSDRQDLRVSLKYATDRVMALSAILILSPVFLFAAIGTALTLGFPILFRQSRVGLDGREFQMLKFRTMTGTPEEHGEADAEWAARTLGEKPAPMPPSSDGTQEPRRTPTFGRFLRRTSIDELPQLFNVLRGEMSMVGPRPGAHLLRADVQRPNPSLQRPPSGQGGNHRVGAGPWTARGHIARRPGRVGQPLHRELVAVARPEDPSADCPRPLPSPPPWRWNTRFGQIRRLGCPHVLMLTLAGTIETLSASAAGISNLLRTGNGTRVIRPSRHGSIRPVRAD